MRKTMYKSILAVIAVGVLSVGMAIAETIDTPADTDNSVSTKTLKLGHNFKNVEPRMDTLQWHFHDWPIENTQKAHTFKGQLKEAVQKLPYEVKAPSYIPYGYEIYTVRQDKNDVLEVVYFIKNSQTYRVGKRNSGSIFVYRMGYSVDTVRDTAYIPAEYKDYEWSEQGESGKVYYTGKPGVQLIRSITWTEGGMAYSLFFLEPVKAVDAEFYKEHVVPVKNIDSSRYELLGNYPVTKISNKTIDEYNKERMIP